MTHVCLFHFSYNLVIYFENEAMYKVRRHLMYVRTQQNRRITCCRIYDHTLKIRPDILKMAAILFFLVFGLGHWKWIFLSLTLRNVSKLWMKMFIRQHAVTIKTNLFNLLISLMLTSWGKYANLFCHFQVS